MIKYLLFLLFLVGCSTAPDYIMYAECYENDKTRHMNELEWEGLTFKITNGSCDIINMEEKR